jgi:hypothetical protein
VGNGGKSIFANGLLYTANGSVSEPEPGILKGTFTGAGLQFNSIMTVDVALGRGYFLTMQSSGSWPAALLRVYDINTFVPIGEGTFPTLGFGSVPDGFSRLVRWGENGLAFRNQTHVVLIQSSLGRFEAEV